MGKYAKAYRYADHEMKDSLNGEHAEYREEAWDIIDAYYEHYQVVEKDYLMEENHQNWLRSWLHKKDLVKKQGGYISPEQHDATIRSCIGLGETLSDDERHLAHSLNTYYPNMVQTFEVGPEGLQ